MIFANEVEIYDHKEVVTLPHLRQRRLRRVSIDRVVELMRDKRYSIKYKPELSNEYYRVYQAKDGTLYVMAMSEED